MDVNKIGQCIASVRKRKGLSQSELAEKLGVSPQAISKWENGHNLPDIENLMRMAEALNVSYSIFLSESWPKDEANQEFEIRERYFHEDNMFTRVRSFAAGEKLYETYRALEFMRERHAGQFRKPGKFTTERIQYINHPLLMTCQAHAYGIRDDKLLASILLHDTVEDTGITVAQLPFSDEVKNLVELVSFSIPDGMTKEEAKEAYYKRIKSNHKACLIKILDRCNNVSTMAGSFSKKKIAQYIKETEEYVLPLTNLLKNTSPEYSDIAFLVKYQIISILETIKNMSLSE